MPFPVSLDNVSYDSPRALATAVSERTARGVSSHARLADAASSGALTRDEAVGLAAALIQTGRAGLVAEGAQLARTLDDPALCQLLLLAHDALDVGILLQSADAGTSVEDLLLGAAASLVRDDTEQRTTVLSRLRNASLGADELRVLARHGTPAEIARGLGSVLLEGVPTGSASDLAAGMKRGPDIADALLSALATLGRPERASLWTTWLRLGVPNAVPDAKQRLFPETA